MNGRADQRRPRRLDECSALLSHLEAAAQQGLRRGGPEAHEDAGSYQRDLRLEPWPARADLARIRFGMDAALAARLPFEVLDDIRDVHPRTADASLFEGTIEQAPGRADERMPREVLGIARLLAD